MNDPESTITIKLDMGADPYQAKDTLNDQEGKLLNNLKNRSELMKSDIISPDMREAVTGPIDPDKHPTIYKKAQDHITSGDCRHCIKLVARHEENDTEFPIDGTLMNAYTQQALAILEHAQKVFEEAQEERLEAKKLNDETKELLADPINMITNDIRKYLKYGFAGGGSLATILAVVLGFLFNLW